MYRAGQVDARQAGKSCPAPHVIFSYSVHNASFIENLLQIPNQIKHTNGGLIKYLLAELGQAGQKITWLSVMAHGPCRTWSVHCDLKPNIFLSNPT